MTTDTPAPATAQAALAHAQAVHSFGRTVSTRLMLWSVLSMAVGALLWRRGSPFWRGFGVQSLGWGAVDAVIAGSGLLGQRRSAQPSAAGDPDTRCTQAAAAAYGSMRGSMWAIWPGASGSPAPRAASDAGWRGQGWGIVVQGAFLFWFDLYHALRVPRVDGEMEAHSTGAV